MTSSKFSTSAKVKLPAQCHKQLSGLHPDYANGEPNILSAFAVWKQPSHGYDIAESFDLFPGPGANSWTGWSGHDGLNLAVHVHQHGSTNVFDFELFLRTATAVIDMVTWTNEQLPQRPPFNSGLLQHAYPPPYPWTQLQVKD